MILPQRFGNIYPNQNQPSIEFTLLALDHAIDHLDYLLKPLLIINIFSIRYYSNKDASIFSNYTFILNIYIYQNVIQVQIF